MNGRLIPALWLLALTAAALFVATAPAPTSDLTQFLPSGATEQQRLMLDELQRGPGTRLVIAAISGAAPRTLANTSVALADKLRRLASVGLVFNGRLQLPAPEHDALFRYRYLLTGGADTARFNEPALHAALTKRLRELASMAGPLLNKTELAADPTGAYRSLLTARAPGTEPPIRDGVWFSKDGKRALMLIHLKSRGFDLDAQQGTIAAIRGAFSEVGGSKQKLELTGPAVFAVDARTAVSSAMRRLSVYASLGVAFLLLIAFRSIRITLLAAVPLVTAVLAGMASVLVTYGQIHGIALAFGVTLVGVAVDYPVHLFSFGAGKVSTADAARNVWPTLRLGALTTCIGYGALLFSGFGGLSQLGLFAVTGLLAAALTTRWVLPYLVRQGSRTSDGRIAHWLERVTSAKRGHRVLGLALLAACVAIALQQGRFWESDLAQLSPIPEAAKRLDRSLRAQLPAPDVRRVLIVTGPTAEAVLQSSEHLRPGLVSLTRAGALTGFDLPSKLLPSTRLQRERRTALPDEQTLRRTLDKALAGLPFRPGVFEPFVHDVAASRTLRPLAPSDLKDTPAGLGLETLLHRRGDTWVGLIALHGVGDPDQVRTLARRSGPNVHFLDLAEQASALVKAYRNEALALCAVGTLLILLVLWVALRDARATARVVLPVGAAVTCTAAVLPAIGQPLTIFHVTSLLLVLGIGLDYALFFERLRQHDEERDATAVALLVCNATTLLVFGILATSTVPVLVSIGSTVAIGAPLSLIFAALIAHNKAAAPQAVAGRERAPTR